MGLKVQKEGFKPVNSLEWRSAIAFVQQRLMFNVGLTLSVYEATDHMSSEVFKTKKL